MTTDLLDQLLADALATGDEGSEAAPDAHIALVDGRFHVTAPYHPALVAAQRQIPGRQYGGKAQPDLNTFPATATVAKLLIDLAEAHDLLWEDSAREAADELAVGYVDLSEMSRRMDGDADVALHGGIALRPFQRAAVDYALAARRTFISIDVGMGKSLVALAAAVRAEAFPVIIVCPAIMRLVWLDEIEKIAERKLTGVIVEGTARGAVHPADVIITGWDTLAARKDDLLRVKARMLVLDEGHYGKNKGTKKKPVLRTQASQELAAAIPADGYVLNLTATAIENRPRELEAQLETLGKLEDPFGGGFRFLERYCNGHQGAYGWEFSGASNLAELHAKLRANCYYRVEKADVVDLPPILERVVEVPGDTETMRAYSTAQSSLAEFIRGEGGDPVTKKAEALVRVGVLLRLAAQARVDAAGAWIEGFLEENPGKKLIAFAHHRDIVDALAARFGALRIQGGQPEVDRKAAIDAFQSDPEQRLIVCSINAAGTGITLTAAEDMVFVERRMNPGKIHQAIGRAWGRLNDLHGANVTHLHTQYAAIDGWLWDMIVSKRAVAAMTLTGDDSTGYVETDGDDIPAGQLDLDQLAMALDQG